MCNCGGMRRLVRWCGVNARGEGTMTHANSRGFAPSLSSMFTIGS
jgi:hypothetical protein